MTRPKLADWRPDHGFTRAEIMAARNNDPLTGFRCEHTGCILEHGHDDPHTGEVNP